MTENKMKNTGAKTGKAAAGVQPVCKCDNILEALQVVLDASKDCHFDRNIYRAEKRAGCAFDYLNERLGITDEGCILLAVIAEAGLDDWALSSGIMNHVGCSRIEVMKRKPLLMEMSVKGLIVYDGKSRYGFPEEVFNAFCRNEVFKGHVQKFGKNDDLYMELYNLHNKTNNDEMSVRSLYHNVDMLLECNADLPFAKAVLKYKNILTDEEYRFLIVTAVSWLALDITNNVYEVRFVFEDKVKEKNLAKNLRNAKSVLITKGLVEKAVEDEIDCEDYTLTDNMKSLVNPEWKKPTSENKKLLAATKISKKVLFYNDDTDRQVSDLAALLKEKKMQDVLRRLRDRNLRCGFTCLFHGGPGTGKTETVYQLARLTGRDIYRVEYSELRSKWIGDSEKNVKAMFDEYRALCNAGGLTPILLLNEADALIGKRMNNAERAADKGENAIQNIILQEMESLDGILIATTNLADNMDRAFERRFLYKIRFEKPDNEARAKIWRSMLPTLTPKEAVILSERFPQFAGGQMENITRKVTVDEVLHGRKVNLENIITLCGHEMIDSRLHGHKVIGFQY